MTQKEIKHTKLTLETHHGTYQVLLPWWDFSFTDYIEMCRSLALANGFNAERVEEFFDDESK